MKKNVFLLLLALKAMAVNGLVFNVAVPAGTKACYIAGDFNAWTHQEMQKTDATHYTINISNATNIQQYKYCSGPGWTFVENTVNGQNRTWTATDVVSSWTTVYDPDALAVDVTYSVTVPAGTNACYFAGAATNWAHTEMQRVDATHYRVVIKTAYKDKYKYCSGPDWKYEEYDANNQPVADRMYATQDVVTKWKETYAPPLPAVTQIPNSLTVSSGSVVRYAFNSTYIGSRTVDVWLPAGYSATKKYAVLYMHDGQMLFDATSTWNGQEWKVDETLSQLMISGEIKDVIVVGIWNSDNRYGEYYPEKTLDYLPATIKTQKTSELGNNPKADEYLSFIVNDVKPFIDKTYSVNTDAANTFVAGSSMGGLISWYALCEYPAVFGAAICMSTHWGVLNTDDASIPDSFRKYLLSKLPSPSSHTLYFDHGTIGLDANYPQNQALADTIMRFKGYTATNWKTQVFTGDDHNETCWANRFNIPAKFIIAKSQAVLNLTGDLDDKGFEKGSVIPIAWTSKLVDNVKIEYSNNNGLSWTIVAAAVSAASGSYNWTAPLVNYGNYKIRISDASNSSTTSVSKIFTIGTALKIIKFTVDMSIMVGQNKFNPATDNVFVKSSAPNDRLLQPMTAIGNNIYSMTVPINANSFFNYKYLINTTNADNGGLENNFPIASNGYRMISVGAKDLQLATVFFNDGDMNLSKSSDHFTVIYTAQDQNLVDNFLERMEVLHKIVAGALQVTPTVKTYMYFYKDRDQFHLAQGYPENPEWATGSAYGKSLLAMVSPTKIGLNDALGLCAHEYTHCLNAWKTKTTLPAWLNEGVACYYGRQFSTKDWIKSEMLKKGKPNIADIWTNDPSMGYAYSGILAYFIIKTKGEAAMSKFIENMNYSDIGYSNINALQTEWQTFLDVYLDYQAMVNVKFSVNMADMIAAGYFKPSTDKVFVKGDQYGLGTKEMTLESGTIYSITIPVNTYSFNEYKFYTNSATAPNSGMELNTDETVLGNRLLDVTNTAKTLNTVTFNSSALPAISGVDMQKVNNKINVLNSHIRFHFSGQYTKYNYLFKKLTPTEYQTQKPTDNLSFDAGFVDANGIINISEPTTTDQKAIFADITNVALYYICQKYMYEFYNTKNLPLILKVGFPVFEAGLLPSDATIKTAVNAYGGSFSSFDVLNNTTTFLQNKGYYIAGVFGEFMNVYKNWAYQYILDPTSTGFNTASWWFNSETKAELLADFNRYVYARFLQPDENLRVKVCVETEHFKFYTNQKTATINFPFFSDVCETAYSQYVSNFKVQAYEKLTFFTMIGCDDGALEGLTCDPNGRLTGGTAWSSGVHSTSSPTAELLQYFYGQNRHELAHSFQGLIGQGVVTAWLNEGFPSFCASGPITDDALAANRQQGIDAMNNAIKYFGHRPTYEETRTYPSPDYGYYTMGNYFIDYQYRKGGYPLIKAIQINDLSACQSLGYTTTQAFLEDFYFDFDIRVQQKPIATLISPVAGTDETNPTVNISWTPLKAGVKLNIAVSTDDAKTWTEIANRTTGTSCVWNSGNMSTRFYIKISAPDNLDVSTTFGPFIKGDLSKLNITSPVLNNYIISGDTTSIKWATTGIQNIKIEYTLNNGTNWTTITNNTSTAANTYNWVVPSGITGSCKLRLTDVTNNANSCVSEIFTIVTPNEVGGPYLYDKNTLLLLHFDNDLNNRSKSAPNAVGDVLNLTNEASSVANLGLSYKNSSAISVPHHANLNLTGDWTIEAWVKLTAYNANSNMYIFWKSGDTDTYQSNYSLEVNPWWGNVFYGYYFSALNNRIGIVGNSPALNEWYHVAFIRDTKKKEIKVIVHDKNRALVSTTTTPYTPNETLVSSKDLLIGTGLSGYIDEMRISNIVRNFTATGIEPLKKTETIEIYPNPATSKVFVRTHNPSVSEAEVYIIGADGQQVLAKKYHLSDNIELDLAGFRPGLYMVKIKNDSIIQSMKLIVK